MTNPTPLSPAAQAVWDATTNVFWRPLIEVPYCHNRVIAAALRALDSQLGYTVLGVRCVDCSQIELIAAELEGTND
jgi:hypothetical protein